MIKRINDNMFQIKTPYKDIGTTLTLIRTVDGDLLFDAASFDNDAADYTLPFLNECGVSAKSLKYIFISHNHTDHAGGLLALIESFPDTVIISGSDDIASRFEGRVVKPHEKETFLGVLEVVKIVGHTNDCAALLDTRTKTLVSGDCLQAIGIVGSGTWAANITYVAEYLEALDKVSKMDIQALVTAHNYYPFTKNVIEGKEDIKSFLDYCYKALFKLKELIVQNPSVDDDGICALHNTSKEIPSFSSWVVKCVRQAIAEGKI